MNADIHLERLCERIVEPRDDYALGQCLNCNAALTQADIENDRCCTQCGSNVDADDEDLADDGYGDCQ